MIFQNKHLPEIEFEIELPGAMRRWEIAVFVRERQPQLNQFELVGVLTEHGVLYRSESLRN